MPLRSIVVWLCVALSAGVVARAPAQQPENRPPTGDTITAFHLAVSLAERRLWVIDGREGDTLFTALVAVGSGRTLRGDGKSWTFDTPTGIATVTAKETNPVWVAPDWHYVEIAREKGLALTRLEFGKPARLNNGSLLTLRNSTVGLVESDSTFRPLPRGEELVFDGKLFIPPFGSLNRQVENVLGQFRLLLSNGVGLHGTPYKESIGAAATHGCIRLYDEDIAWLFDNVPIGTRVLIY